jgi:hypothetical protein
MIIMMRTTLNLPDDVYDVIRSFAEVKHIPFGQAVAELVRRGLRSEMHLDRGEAFPTFFVPEGSEPITLEQTLSAEDDA